jgi:hypothetical protein
MHTVLSNRATEQHQDSTTATPKQQQDRATAQTERGQSVVALSTRTRLLINCIFFIQFISPFAQKFKKGYERDTFHNSKRDTDSPHPFTVI